MKHKQQKKSNSTYHISYQGSVNISKFRNNNTCCRRYIAYHEREMQGKKNSIMLDINNNESLDRKTITYDNKNYKILQRFI